MSGKRVVLAAGAAVVMGMPACTSLQPVRTERRPAPEAVVPSLFDPSAVYRQLGFLAQGPPVSFVGAVSFLGGPTPDSTLALFSLSLANGTLSFQRSGPLFEAGYRVDATFRSGSFTRQLASDQTVRVSNFAETQRADESVIFQQSLFLPPGDVTVTLLVHDRNSGRYSRDERAVTVPKLDTGPALSSIVPLYRGEGRTARSGLPDLLVNPRSTVPYGGDTLRLYFEAYGVPAGTPLVLRVVDERNAEVWRGTTALSGNQLLRAAVVRLGPGSLPIGRLRIQGMVAGGRDTVQSMVLVSFFEQWVAANFDDVLNMLRYFGAEDAIRAMRAAPDSARPDLWRKFWQTTDPNPTTPENEALQQYFTRLQSANARFREGTDPGWLTDRGEVFISLGEPDEIFDQGSDLQGQRRVIRWTYTRGRLVLDYVDESGFGRFRLTPSSRAEFDRAAGRVRRGN